MKHQLAISNQRVLNMKAGIDTANGQITRLENSIEEVTPKNFEELKDGLLDEMEEIKEFLNWVSSQ